MSRHKLQTSAKQQGFTLVELVIVMIVGMIVATTFYTFFRASFFSYLNLQKDASSFSDLARQSHRVANVVRGLTDISSASSNDLVIYGYFYPTDTYVSLIHYYLSVNGKILYADVTPMTSNPPIGTPISSDLKTYTIIDNFKQVSGVNLFEYLDSTGAIMGLPIIDLHTVKGVRVNLAVDATTTNTNQAMSVEVSLRNRKTNL